MKIKYTLIKLINKDEKWIRNEYIYEQIETIKDGRNEEFVIFFGTLIN